MEHALTAIHDFTADAARQFAFRKYIAPVGDEIHFGKARNRSVTGSMNQLIGYAEGLLNEARLTPDEVGFKLNDFLLSALAIKKSDGDTTPDRAFQALIDQKRKNENSQYSNQPPCLLTSVVMCSMAA